MGDKPLSIFDISGRAMSAQLVRLNTTASNMANAGTVAGSKAAAFRALRQHLRTKSPKTRGFRPGAPGPWSSSKPSWPALRAAR